MMTEHGENTPGTAEKKWYVVRVQSGREEQVAAALKRRVQAAGLQEQVTDVIVPMEKVTEIRSGRKTVRDRKIYAGYIVIEMAQTKEAWFLVRETPGIGDFLGLKEPIPLAEHEVSKLKASQAPEEGDKPKIKIDFQKGDSVRIKEGAFENFEGVAEEINAQKGLVCVTITIFGRPTRVDLEYWQVEKI